VNTGMDAGRAAPEIDVQFDRPGRRYSAGDPLVVRYRIGGLDVDAVRAVEVSVAWYTEGKGEEDLFVHAFERIVDRDGLRTALQGDGLEVRLPASPLSYEGVIVKIRWCVRLRVFYVGGRDYVSEHVFDVGSVPPARPPTVQEAAP
jgi:hypothetical protein